MRKLKASRIVPLLGLLRLALAVAVAAVCYGAFAPASGVPLVLAWDKAEHFASFFILTVLCLASFPNTPAMAIGAALSAFGAGIEVVQGFSFVARDSDVWDWAADTLAVGAALLVLAAAQVRASAAGEPRRPLLEEG